jgi:hypothetical protein
MSFDRYAQFREGNQISMVPFGEIPKSSSDRHIIYKKGLTRLDKVSYDFYGSPDYAWLILQANPQYGSLEFNIPDGVELRIPMPLNAAIDGYQSSIERYNKLYK